MEKIVLDVDSFNPEHIFKCGQAFRWRELEDGSYLNIAHGKVIRVVGGSEVILENANFIDYQYIWKNYFDLERDYSALKESFSGDSILKPAIEYGSGIRVLNQEPFETIITFIISANNQIPRIKNAVDKIASMYGEKISNPYLDAYSFPKAEVLAEASPKDLREFARVGFRDERIVEASKLIRDGEIDFSILENSPIDEARKELMKLPGVGPKVADCVLLFAFKRSESFPVDVWIKRVMEELYIKGTISKNKVAEYGRKQFGNLAGFAQQYLFYYGRENDLGK